MMVLSLSSFAATPPKEIQKAFAQRFPNATHVKWDKENAQATSNTGSTTEYEASFEWKGAKYSANFNEAGEWLETESPIAFNQLPENVQKAFNGLHKGATVKAVAKIDTSKGATQYEVEYKHGMKTVEQFYAADGTEIKK